MSIDLQPAELGFRRPFDHEVTETLTLSNPNSASLAFKVKTTAPKQYCVRPNSGLIPPNSSVDVQVLLQAMKEQPPLEAKCRDKFLVQSVLITGEQEANVTTLWQNVEKTAKASIQERKIRVNFLSPNGGAVPTTNGLASHEEEPPAYTSPTPLYGSPAPESKMASTPAQGPLVGPAPPPPQQASANTGIYADTDTSANTGTSASTGISGMAAAVANAVPTSSEDVQRQLADARAQISKLTSQIADPQLRQRKAQEASDKVQQVVAQTSDQGVPLQIVAALCLLSFLIAYLFF